MRDAVDGISDQWAQALPDLDVTPMHVVGRLSRASRLLERGIKEHLATRDLEPWEFDSLLTLLRSNPEHTMCMKDVTAAMLVSPATLTNRMDRLVERGLVTRSQAPGNRRMVLVTLTDEGARLATEIVYSHVDNEQRMLAALDPAEQDLLAGLLRKLLHSLGDG
ncbi:MarR family winged helix-turn-helix transcriptional regulator [Nonomuraea sp. NPDC050663]|uniref:MarR family winged helix-turn-helix transcriptional regulator n=1 Tax=Nonomuraea sp. NPDC050663 TaxID=3364370 RepID=UPI00379C9212